jgi:kojibiose phosphorylase
MNEKDRIKNPDSAWQMVEDNFDPRKLAHFETLFTLSNGYAGVRGSLSMSPLLADPGFYVAGVYESRGGYETELVNLPCWLSVSAYLDGFTLDLKKGKVIDYRRVLDMRRGILITDITWKDDAKRTWKFTSNRIMHQTEKHLGLEWGTVTVIDAGGKLELISKIDAWAVKHGSLSGKTCYDNCTLQDSGNDAGISLQVTTKKTGFTVSESSIISAPGVVNRMVSIDDDRIEERLTVPVQPGEVIPFKKFTTIYTSRDVENPSDAAVEELKRLTSSDFDGLVDEHIKAWEEIWNNIDICIDGDGRAQLGMRFNLFHLASMPNKNDDKVSIGAKGLHGNGYQGHVYWDTEIFMLPMFIYTQPDIARTLLQYRYNFLSDAVENAREMGVAGAKYPWHSSHIGRETSWLGWQEHLNPDIAYAVDQYISATGDDEFYLKYGAELIIATAAYWPARVVWEDGKGYVLHNTCGPDEIHTNISNNAYTNYLIRWHMQRAVKAAKYLQDNGKWKEISGRYAIKDADLKIWDDIGNKMYLPYLPGQIFLNQFDGHELLPEREIDRTMTKMQYVGPVQHSFKTTKVAQQADTVLLYTLFPHDFSLEEQKQAYLFYDPRCSHTSTLSRCIYSRVATQSGMLDEGLRQFMVSLETDTGVNAECESGIHAACLGGNWLAMIMGFGGFTIKNGMPSFAPVLPEKWSSLSYCIKWRGIKLNIKIEKENIEISTDSGKCDVLIAGNAVSVTTEPQKISYI